MKEKLLSICMITKNDDKYIAESIKYIKQIADEIIIVDLGSIDKTLKIAKQSAVDVYQVEWNNNFSEIKNFCLDKANGKWILFLQPNETISKEHLKQIKQLLDNPNVEGYLFYTDYRIKGMGVFSPIQLLRLLRSRKEYRYNYKSFEMIPDELLSNIEDTNIQITYKDGAAISWDLKSRIILLENEINKYPKNSYLQYMYGIILHNRGDYEVSLKYFKNAYKYLNEAYLYAPHLYKCLSWILIYFKEYTEALNILNEGIENYLFYTDLLILRGEIYRQKRQYKEAICDVEICLKMRERPNFLVPGPEINVTTILEILAEIYKETFYYQKALEYYLQAYELSEENYDYLYEIGELTQITKSSEIIDNLISHFFEKKSKNQLMIIIDILFKQGEFTKVLTLINHLDSIWGKCIQTESIKISCSIMLGEGWEKIHEINNESLLYNGILLRRIESHWFSNSWAEAKQLLKELDRIENLEYSFKDLYRSLHEILTGIECNFRTLTQSEYETVQILCESLIRIGQEKKAESLLDILLWDRNDEDCFKLAKPWAEIGRHEIILKICHHISEQNTKEEFKQKMLGLLLYYNHIDAALKLIERGKIQIQKDMECVLWSKCRMKNLEKWLNTMQASLEFNYSIPSLQAINFQNKELLIFYNDFIINADKNTDVNEDIDLTCAEIHRKIGTYYKMTQNYNTALTAFLRSLQYAPLNEYIQEKINDFSNKKHKLFLYYLEKTDWILENAWFKNKKHFIYYVRGIVAYKSRKYNQAVQFFSQAEESKDSPPFISAYLASCLWIDEKEDQIQLSKYEINNEFISMFIYICKDSIIKKLNEIHQKYPYSGLIQIEKGRIKDI